ncbi:hypothetical protein [Streptomyces sp. NBC_00454]|uniref:hypothetical protein n=1 Tax=Streptomyces sp. NBC_00454 TaxID=2975747 RepID=UPI0030E4A469
MPTAAVVDLTLDKKCADRAGTLAFSLPDNAPATQRFTLIRGVEHTPQYGWALVEALLAAMAVFLLMIWQADAFGTVRRNWPGAKMPIDAPYSVKDSWLTTAKFKAVGHGWGLVLSASTTLTGDFGQLATLFAMVISADGTGRDWTGLVKVLLEIGLCAAAALVTLYAVRFVRGALAVGCPGTAPGQSTAVGSAKASTAAPVRTSSTAAL